MSEKGGTLWDKEARIGRQVVLSWPRAIEIAWKGMSVRIWRSLIALSSIILAIAFLMAILTNTCLIASLSVKPLIDVKDAERAGLLARDATVSELSSHKFASWVALMKDKYSRTKQSLLQQKAELESKISDQRKKAEVRGRMSTAMKNQIKRDEEKLKSIEEQIARVDSAFQDGTPAQLLALRDFLKEEKKDRQDIHAAIERYLQKQGHTREDKELLLSQKRAIQRRISELESTANTTSAQQRELRELQQELRNITKRISRLEVQESVMKGTAVSVGAVMGVLHLLSDKDKWLAGLALLVCLVGIVNAMLMSVTERFREIGTMKCLGALDSFIVRLFLIESSFEGFVGTVVGIILGFALSFLFNGLWNYGRFAIRYFPTSQIIYSALFCLVIGTVLAIVGALYPAYRAAKMEPVVAMRVEE